MKKLTIVGTNISQKQWSNLVLELNLIKKSWKLENLENLENLDKS